MVVSRICLIPKREFDTRHILSRPIWRMPNMVRNWICLLIFHAHIMILMLMGELHGKGRSGVLVEGGESCNFQSVNVLVVIFKVWMCVNTHAGGGATCEGTCDFSPRIEQILFQAELTKRSESSDLPKQAIKMSVSSIQERSFSDRSCSDPIWSNGWIKCDKQLTISANVINDCS